MGCDDSLIDDGAQGRDQILAKALAHKMERRYGLDAQIVQSRILPALGPDKLFRNGEDLMLDGTEVGQCFVIVEGFAAHYKLLRSGKRQITGISIPGDIANLATLYCGRADHAIAALGPVVVRAVAHEQLRDLMDASPDIRRAIGRHLADELFFHRERIVSMGRRSAIEHFATLICELYWRLLAVDRAHPDGFLLPITQSDMADALGLSTVHVNRIVKHLRNAGVVRFAGHQVAIADWERLCEIAGLGNHLYTSLFPDRTVQS